MIWRVLKNTDKKCLYKFIYNMVIKGAIGFNRFQQRMKAGDFFPAFHFISVTDDCNLNCQGCWVIEKKDKSRLSPGQIDEIIITAKSKGSYFFGILGGEPLMYKPLFNIFRKHPDCYFQLFTNGTLLTAEVAGELRKIANVTPLISFEGDENVADIRRGGKDIFKKTNEAIENATNAGLITGVAMSVCKSNYNLALSPKFITSLIQKGVSYIWYYIYRPVGANPCVELCLDSNEILQLRKFMVEARSKYNIVVIDAYWDEEGRPLCPVTTGLSHHINPSGYIEPCPVIQFAAEKLGGKPLPAIYNESLFLKNIREAIPSVTPGCIIMENPVWLADFVESNKAADTSGRGDEIKRLRAMPGVPSHSSIPAIPETNRWYRFAKKRAFFGMGAYG